MREHARVLTDLGAECRARPPAERARRGRGSRDPGRRVERHRQALARVRHAGADPRRDRRGHAGVRHVRGADPARRPHHRRRSTGSRPSAGSTSPCSATPSAARSTRSRPSSTSPVLGEPAVHAVFIRAPLVLDAGGGRSRRSRRLDDGRIVAVRAGVAARHRRSTPRSPASTDSTSCSSTPCAPSDETPRQRLDSSSMTINDWWRDRPEERYWMIAPSRGIVGDALSAPKASDDRRFEWSHELVGFTEPGDTLFVWDRTLRCAGDRRVGSRARAARRGDAAPAAARSMPHWRMPVSDTLRLAAPITLSALRRIGGEIVAVRDDVEAFDRRPRVLPVHRRRPTRSRRRPRTCRKVPRDLVALLSSRFGFEFASDGRADDDVGRAPARRERRRHHDPQRRPRGAVPRDARLRRRAHVPGERQRAVRDGCRASRPREAQVGDREGAARALRLRRLDRARHARRARTGRSTSSRSTPTTTHASRGWCSASTTPRATSWPGPRHPST